MPKLSATAFTDRFLASLKPTTKRQAFFDAVTRGLVFTVSPGGTRSFYYVYKRKGRPRWYLLGHYPSMTLADARDKWREAYRKVNEEGSDPVSEEPTPLTFGDFVPVYLAFVKGRKVTWKEDEWKINKHLRPVWGERALDSITRKDIHWLLDRLIAKGMKTGVNRVQSLISRMFTVALDRGLVDAHPCARMIKRFDERKFARTRVLSDAEIKTLWELLASKPERSADVVRLRLLTGQRVTRQIMLMEWPEVDFDRGLWTIPQDRMKKNRPHVVPLSPTVFEILQRRRAAVPEPQRRVFPGLTPTHDEYRNVLTIGEHFERFDWRDLRRTMTTRLAEMGTPKEIRRAILSHAEGGDVEDQHYNMYEFLDEKRRALDKWDQYVSMVVNGRKPDRRVLKFSR